jgi:tripartite-type tricarboxylate transporter receptor subunit TctC
MVDNRAGAGGLIGSDIVAKAPGDGYTLLIIGVPHFTARWYVDGPIPFDPIKDFAPLAKMCNSALCFVVKADSPYKTLTDLVSAMRQKSGEITYSSGGAGSTSHLCTVVLNNMTNTRARHVPYKGNTPAVTDVIAGQVDFTCQGAPGVLPMVKAGKLRALAVTGLERWRVIPDVPTVAETGIAGYNVSSLIGALAPAATPAAIVQRLSSEIVNIARSPAFRDFCTEQSMAVDISDHQKFLAEMPEEDAQWKRIAQFAKSS